MALGGRLEEFVHQTLVEIVTGVVQARAAIEAVGGQVGTKVIRRSKRVNNESGSFSVPSSCVSVGLSQSIEFDVAVSTRAEKSSKRDGKLQVWVLGIGGGDDSTVVASEVSRLRFSVPVKFPPSSRVPE